MDEPDLLPGVPRTSLPEVVVVRTVYHGVWYRPWTWLSWRDQRIRLGGTLYHTRCVPRQIYDRPPGDKEEDDGEERPESPA